MKFEPTRQVSVIRNGSVCKVKEAIKQRLMYSFGFTYEQAEQELSYLFATTNTLYLAEYYTLKVRRVGATKVLNRSDKKEIHKHAVSIIFEYNTDIASKQLNY